MGSTPRGARGAAPRGWYPQKVNKMKPAAMSPLVKDDTWYYNISIVAGTSIPANHCVIPRLQVHRIELDLKTWEAPPPNHPHPVVMTVAVSPSCYATFVQQNARER